MRRPTEEPLSLWAVATTDGPAFVVGWMLVIVVGCVAVIALDALVTGRRPAEPWSEIAGGVALIVAVLYGLLRSRAGRLTRLLAEGDRVEASVEHYLDAGQWVRLKLAFDLHGRALGRTLLLPSSRRTRRLRERDLVELAVDAAKPKRLVVADLYE